MAVTLELMTTVRAGSVQASIWGVSANSSGIYSAVFQALAAGSSSPSRRSDRQDDDRGGASVR